MNANLDLLDENRHIGRIVFYLAWPAIIEQLLITLVQYVDTAMVGSLGQNATAAVALTSSTNWLINGLCAAIAVGLSVPVGMSIGAKDFEKGKAVARQAVLIVLSLGALLTLLAQLLAPFIPVWLGADKAILADATAYFRIFSMAYLFNLAINVASSIIRCCGDTRTPLIFNMMTNVINVVLNFLLIFPSRTLSIFGKEIYMIGAGLGVKGAAIASAIATAFSGIMLMRALFSKRSIIPISLKDKYRFDKAIWKDMVRLGSPLALERATVSFGQIAITAMVTSLGTTSLAAHHLAITAESITYMPAFGISAAATTLVAQSLGANKKDLAVKYGKICIYSGAAFMSLMGVFLYFCSHFLVSIFSNEACVIALGGHILMIEAFSQPFFALNIVGSGALRGARDTRSPFLIGLIAMWGVRIPIAFVLINFFHTGVSGAWYAMVIGIMSAGLMTYIRFMRKKWLKG